MDAWWDSSVNATYTFSRGTIPYTSGASTHGGVSIVLGGPHSADLSLFWITTSGAVMQSVNDAASNSWKPPVTVDTTAATDSGLSAVTTQSQSGASANGRVNVAWVGPDGTVHTACNDVGWPCYLQPAGHWGSGIVSGPGSATHDPISMFSGGPNAADIFYVDPTGDLKHASWNVGEWNVPSEWTLSQVASYACNTCGQAGSIPCNGNALSCPQGTSSVNGQTCQACGLDTEPACNDSSGNRTVCNQAGTYLGTDPASARPGYCLCDSATYPGNVNTTEFDFYLATLLDQISITAKNNSLTVTIPNGVPIPGGGTSSLSLPAGDSINSLSIPANPSAGMLWQLDQNAGQIDVTTNLSASITAYFNGVNGIGSCSATITLDSAPLFISLVADASGAGLQTKSVNLGATDPTNMHISGCSAIQGDVEGKVMDEIQGQLSTRLNSMLQNSGVLTTMVNTLANKPNSSSGGTLLAQLPSPPPSSSTYSWTCHASGLAVGQIDGTACAAARSRDVRMRGTNRPGLRTARPGRSFVAR